MTTPIKDKKPTSVANQLFLDIMLKFGFPRILQSDNGVEFKSKLTEDLPWQLGIRQTFISPCHPQINRKLESSHRIIEYCTWKFSLDGVLEWDQLFPCTTAAFNLFPNEHSQESPHFLYFGCDPYLPHFAAFLQPKIRYLGSAEGMIHLENLRQAYMLAALNAREVHSKQSKQKYDNVPSYKICALVMMRNFEKKS